MERHKVITSEVLAAVGCVCLLKDLQNKNVFSLDLKTDSELLLMTDAGSEFCFAKLVRANGWMNIGIAVDRSVHALMRRLICWLSYRGAEVFRILYINIDTL